MTLVPSHKLKVSGQAVVASSDLTGAPIAPPCSNSTKPCTAVSSVVPAPTKLKVDGQPVALDSLTGVTDGTDAALKPAIANQSKLKA